MGIAAWLFGLVSRPIVTNAASRIDGWLALRARVMFSLTYVAQQS